jgi:hypothetical protein
MDRGHLQRTEDAKRRANEWMWEGVSAGGGEHSVPFLCECGGIECHATVWLTPREYVACRAAAEEGSVAAPEHSRRLMVVS